MKLSHRKKVASKHGIYWPSRTKQARELREAQAKLAVKIAQVFSQEISIFTAANQMAQALSAFVSGVAQGIKSVKAWMLNRDESQQNANALHDGRTVKILAKTPRKDKNL
ncbi:hypothetical protein CAG61_08455 [Vibrio sp. V34_P3A8T189]|uniref:hypothetical protein n=1 Tax=unclassified Vibrio TaxID=2614977 RepID=UPI001372B5C1|nr:MULTISPECIES: hypothetical protein [unclassified Vibrio]NAW78337.1 hypothetical protein [Vibrio sp. V33_P6A3T137]NAX01884.1 hypothetical protein [Vibrio sp. V34_P3A8T189]NAX08237.1 hypothetical protein [Vibrio sp. V40_P2S30T141]